MTPAKFLESRKNTWKRFSEIINKTKRKGISALNEDELYELTRLYPTIALDVARARMYGIDPNTQHRLNDLAISAHGLLYRRKHVRPIKTLWKFFSCDYPRLFRRLSAYFAITLGLFTVCTIGAYAGVRIQPSNAYLFVPSGLDVVGGPEVTAKDVSERYRMMHGSIMTSFITTNNIQVAFYAFTLGITAAIGTCYVLSVNAMMLGGFFGHFANHGLLYTCYSFLVPHGALEIFAILVSGAAGLRMGLSLAVPGRLTRKASLRAGAKEAVMLVLGTIPMFIVAGIIESFVTPSYLDGWIKITIGITALGITLLYLFFTGSKINTCVQPHSAA